MGHIVDNLYPVTHHDDYSTGKQQDENNPDENRAADPQLLRIDGGAAPTFDQNGLSRSG